MSAELNSLESLSDTTFLDSKIRELEAQISKLNSNREIEVLKNREKNLTFSDELQSLKEQIETLKDSTFAGLDIISFSNAGAVSPTNPTKPKKRLILIIATLLGGMIGFFTAIWRIIYLSRK